MVLVSASATQRIVLLRVVAHNNIEFTKFVYFGVRLSMQLVHNKHNEIWLILFLDVLMLTLIK